MLSHRKIKALLLLFMIMLVMPVYSQVITGKVIDANNKEPIIGASIQVKGTSIGTMSDLDGQFKITVKDKNASLQVSYVGYKTVVQPLNGKTSITITLQESTQELDQVVVIGYGAVSYTHLTLPTN